MSRLFKKALGSVSSHADPNSIKRIVVCVDGTWYNADGKEGEGTGNASNTHRVCASVKDGSFRQNDKTVTQVCKYFPGLGTKRSTRAAGYVDAWSGDCDKLIQSVYKYCCSEVTSESDELWLFGFSRGAYVVRVVAALFTKLGTLKKQDSDTFKTALSLLEHDKENMSHKVAQLYQHLREQSKPGPNIKFLGLFDTVEQSTGKLRLDPAHDMSIDHIRHALALNEDRVVMEPDMYQPPSGEDRAPDWLVQAWFAGWHLDIGGGARDDGLSLYPLQWMLLECQRYGLMLAMEPQKWIIELLKKQSMTYEHPPSLVLPDVVDGAGSRVSIQYADAGVDKKGDASSTPSVSSSEAEKLKGSLSQWGFEVGNGYHVTMHDLRAIHDMGNLQEWKGNKLRKRKAPEQAATHKVRLNPPTGVIMSMASRRPRPVFNPRSVDLAGYSRTGPYSTIIHPSVYFLKDTYPSLDVGRELLKLEAKLETFRQELRLVSGNAVSSRNMPWVLEGRMQTSFPQVRILICGPSGVGKSTLLNRIFGVDMAMVSHESRGIHDIRQGFESDQHAGVIIHDSEGFEAGDTTRVEDFEKFIKERGSIASHEEKLHVVWICNEMDTKRPMPSALERIIDFIAKSAPDLPVIFVGTMKDKFLKLSTELAPTEIRALESGQAAKDMLDADVARDLEKAASWRRQLEAACPVASQKLLVQWSFVGKDNPESIKALMRMTEKSIAEDSIRMGFAAAQIVDGEPKMRHAIDETMSFLSKGITISNASAWTVLTNMATVPVIARILCNAIVCCYGLADSATIGAMREEQLGWVMTSVVSQNLGAYMGRHFGTAIGGIASLGFGAAFIEAPIIARLMLRCACDLIIILDRAFQLGNSRATKLQIRQAESEYLQKIWRPRLGAPKSSRQIVHREIAALVPALSNLAHNVFKPEEVATYRRRVSKIILDNRLGNPDGAPPTYTGPGIPATVASVVPGVAEVSSDQTNTPVVAEVEGDQLMDKKLIEAAASQEDEEVDIEVKELERQVRDKELVYVAHELPADEIVLPVRELQA